MEGLWFAFCQDKQLNNSRGKYDRYASKRDIPSIDGFCGHSPSLQPSPRYANKTGHGDRKMEKDRGNDMVAFQLGIRGRVYHGFAV